MAPTAAERDEAERFDRSIFTRMGELGLTAAPIPELVGGAGFSYLGWTLVMEELGAADMAMAVSRRSRSSSLGDDVRLVSCHAGANARQRGSAGEDER